MYSNIKNVQIIVALLKKYGIRHIVLSPGARNIPFVVSVENDDFFKCYSIVDERSAAFFGLGLAEKLCEPVAICCTSGTAVSNYVSAITEAFYQKLPIVALTADRDAYCLNQLEDQDIPQMSYFKEITKKSVNIPIIECQRDYDYSVRAVNEALLEINHNGTGPVHINMQVGIGPEETDFSADKLPDVRKIDRIMIHDLSEMKKMAEKLYNAKKILVIYGQNPPVNDEYRQAVEDFFDSYNCVIGTELMSNFSCRGSLDIDNAPHFKNSSFSECIPEIVISLNGNFLSDYKGALKSMWSFDHWLVSPEGSVADPYKKLTNIFEGSSFDFFKIMAELAPNKRMDYSFYDTWKSFTDSLPVPEPPYSDFYAVKKFMETIPENSVLHLGNSNSVRLAQIFPVKKGVEVYCNRGTNGIDGSMSSFMGNAVVSNSLCFLLIGDLSFFYDMNALWNRYVNKNIRIMLSNNSGAGIFHFTRDINQLPNLDLHTAAEHDAEAKGWVESRGFIYLSAHNQKELDEAMEKFVSSDSDKPVFLEVFTDKEINKTILKDYYSSWVTQVDKVKSGIKKVVRKVIKK